MPDVWKKGRRIDLTPFKRARNEAAMNNLLGKKCHIRADKCDNPAESQIDFTIIEDNGDRLLIETVEWPYYIKPVECILTANVEIID
jgi:hypothetical protein